MGRAIRFKAGAMTETTTVSNIFSITVMVTTKGFSSQYFLILCELHNATCFS